MQSKNEKKSNTLSDPVTNLFVWDIGHGRSPCIGTLSNEVEKRKTISAYDCPWPMSLSEQLYKSGRIRPTLSTGQFSNLSKNQCYISRWTLWHIKFGAVTKTEALGVISSFRGWISLYRASRQNVLFFSRYAE